MRYLLTILSLFTFFPLIAQHFSDNGKFSIPQKEICAPYTNLVITSTALECGNCTADFNATDAILESIPIFDNVPVDNSLFPGYTTPGTYVIQVQFGSVFDRLEIVILPSAPPAFELYTCSNNEVRVNITDTQASQYTLDYNNDNVTDLVTPPGMLPPHGYGSSLTQTIKVRANFPNCPTATQTFTPQPGTFTPGSVVISGLEVLPTDEINLDLSTTDNFYYELAMKTDGGPASVITTLNNQDNFQVTGLQPDDHYYCFQVAAVDICQTPPTPVLGNEICSADLNLTLQPDVHNLAWRTGPGISQFQMIKTPGAALPLISGSATSYNDSDIYCGTNYCYQLITNYGGGITSTSKTFCGVATSNRPPKAIDNITSVIEGTEVKLNWVAPDGPSVNEYVVKKQYNGFTSTTVSTPAYSDAAYEPFMNMCYQVEYTDLCGLRSAAGPLVCPVNLTGAPGNDNSITLQWTSYTGWIGGVAGYMIEKYDQDGNLVSSTNVSGTLSYTDTNAATDPGQVYTYRVLALANNGTLNPLPAVSNVSRVIKNPNLSHPTAFIPNSTIEANKNFRIFGGFISEYEMKVFNRWGELMFESTEPETGWDGTYRGMAMPEGTYIFRAKITDEAGRTFNYAGSVVLLKKQ